VGILEAMELNQAKQHRRPSWVQRGVLLLYVAVAIGLLRTALELRSLLGEAQSVGASVYIFAAVVLGLTCFVISLIGKGRNGARWVFLLLLVAGIPFSIEPLIESLRSLSVSGFIGLAQLLLQCLAMGFLFLPESSAWFQNSAKLRKALELAPEAVSNPPSKWWKLCLVGLAVGAILYAGYVLTLGAFTPTGTSAQDGLLALSALLAGSVYLVTQILGTQLRALKIVGSLVILLGFGPVLVSSYLQLEAWWKIPTVHVELPENYRGYLLVTYAEGDECRLKKYRAPMGHWDQREDCQDLNNINADIKYDAKDGADLFDSNEACLIPGKMCIQVLTDNYQELHRLSMVQMQLFSLGEEERKKYVEKVEAWMATKPEPFNQFFLKIYQPKADDSI
jgi:hypothetical protein